jgi:hypothetical protein
VLVSLQGNELTFTPGTPVKEEKGDAGNATRKKAKAR